MIVEKCPLYFELEVVYKLLKLHNAIEESNSSQHTKQTDTHTHTYIYIYIYISQEKRVVILLPIMDVTKLVLQLTTPELRILITVRFDYLWVVFFSGFQQYTMSSSTTQVNMNFLTMLSFCTFIFQIL